MIKVEYVRDGLVEEFHEGYWVSAKTIKGFSPDNTHDTPYFLRGADRADLRADFAADTQIRVHDCLHRYSLH